MYKNVSKQLRAKSQVRHTAEELNPAGRLSEAVQIIEELHFDKDIDLPSNT